MVSNEIKIDRMIDAKEALSIMGVTPSHPNAKKAKEMLHKYDNPIAYCSCYRVHVVYSLMNSWR